MAEKARVKATENIALVRNQLQKQQKEFEKRQKEMEQQLSIQLKKNQKEFEHAKNCWVRFPAFRINEIFEYIICFMLFR